MSDRPDFSKDRDIKILWARTIMENPHHRTLIADTETADVSMRNREVIELAIIDLDGKELLNTRFFPMLSINPDATAIHGITKDMLRGCPGWLQPNRDQIAAILEPAAMVIGYNVFFDVGAITRTCELHKVEPIKFMAQDLMIPYSVWFGEWGGTQYRRQPLRGGDHSALGDCQATLRYLQKMAGSALSTEHTAPGVERIDDQTPLK